MKNIIIYIIVVLSFFFFVDSVKAATRAANEVTIGGGSFPRTISVNTSGVNNLLGATLSSTYAYGYEYAIVEMCSSIGLEASVYNPSYNYYFNDTSYLYNTRRSCTTSGSPGQIYYMFLSVGKWDIGSGNVSLYYVSSYIRLRSTWGYNGYVTFQKFMFSDEDMSIEIQQNQNIVNNINNSFNSLNQTQQETNDKLDDVNQNIDETNQTLDEIKDMDISDEDKELPNDDAYQDYTEAEDDLMDAVNEADLDVLEIAIDEDSSNFVWDTLTELIQSHTLIFGTVIAILSIGIIKLALGR